MSGAEYRLTAGLALCAGIVAAAAAAGALLNLSGGGQVSGAMAALSAPRGFDAAGQAVPVNDAPQASSAERDLHAGNTEPASQPRGVLNGYKGYRYRRPGYKSGGDGWWYPDSAFSAPEIRKQAAAEKFAQLPVKAAQAASLAEAALSPAEDKGRAEKAKPEIREVKKPKPRAQKREMPQAALMAQHRQWCAAHHPSYSAGSNSYREGFGRKKQCASPYFH